MPGIPFLGRRVQPWSPPELSSFCNPLFMCQMGRCAQETMSGLQENASSEAGALIRCRLHVWTMAGGTGRNRWTLIRGSARAFKLSQFIQVTYRLRWEVIGLCERLCLWEFAVQSISVVHLVLHVSCFWQHRCPLISPFVHWLGTKPSTPWSSHGLFLSSFADWLSSALL